MSQEQEKIDFIVMVLPNIIRKIRITALLLFLVPTIALLGTLLSHNLLASFNFSKDLNFKIENNFFYKV